MPKARKEGDNALENVEAALAQPVQPEAPKGRPSKPFREAIAAFREKHPEKWEEIALCPTQHGVDIIAEHLERL